MRVFSYLGGSSPETGHPFALTSPETASRTSHMRRFRAGRSGRRLGPRCAPMVVRMSARATRSRPLHVHSRRPGPWKIGHTRVSPGAPTLGCRRVPTYRGVSAAARPALAPSIRRASE
jgi:hypothetical protein